MGPDGVLVVVLALPAIVGTLVAIINSDGVNTATERVEAWARANEARVSARRGKFGRFVVRPLLLAMAKFSDWTDGFAHRGIKNGARLAGTLYLGMAWFYLMFVLIQIAVVVLIAVALIYVVVKVIVSYNPDVRRGYEIGRKIIGDGTRRG